MTSADASILTGDYSHTTGVYGNGGQWGGFNTFTAPPEGNSISSINDTTTIAVDMQQAKISPQFYEAPLA